MSDFNGPRRHAHPVGGTWTGLGCGETMAVAGPAPKQAAGYRVAADACTRDRSRAVRLNGWRERGATGIRAGLGNGGICKAGGGRGRADTLATECAAMVGLGI